VTRGKGLPLRAQIALVGVGGVVILALSWLLLFEPKQRHISDLRSQAAAVQTQITEDLARAAHPQGSNGATAVKTADVYKLDKAMPSETDMPDLLLELDQTAKASGVTIDSLGFGQPAPSTDGTYSSIPITVQANGNFYTLTDFLYRLRSLVYVSNGALQASGRIFSVGVFAVTPAQKSLSAQITLDTYLYGSSLSGAAAPATPGTTTTTTATTTTTPSSGPTAAGATS